MLVQQSLTILEANVDVCFTYSRVQQCIYLSMLLREKKVLRILLQIIIIENRRISENGTNGDFK